MKSPARQGEDHRQRRASLAVLGRPKLGAAAGLRVAWNRNFVIRFDYGFGISEPYANGNIYLTFDEMF